MSVTVLSYTTEMKYVSVYIILILFREVILIKNVGDGCETQNGLGVCVPFMKCADAINGLGKNIYPVNCGYEGKSPIVCCEISNKTAQMCDKYEELVRPLRVYAIVGGEDAYEQEFPHMAALGFGEIDKPQWLCGGSLISDNFVLTAAHCLKHSEVGEVKFVRIGGLRLDSQYPTLQDFNVKRRIPHPEYKPPSCYNDIALVELDKPAVFSPWVKPACLYNSPWLPADEDWQVTATGWGLTQFGGSPSTVLQKVDLDLFPNEHCNAFYKNSLRKVPHGILEQKQICAGGKGSQKDTCQGDSGGPLQIYDFLGLYRVVGITSFGKACGVANTPAVYSRVFYYIPWIENIVWP